LHRPKFADTPMTPPFPKVLSVSPPPRWVFESPDGLVGVSRLAEPLCKFPALFLNTIAFFLFFFLRSFSLLPALRTSSFPFHLIFSTPLTSPSSPFFFLDLPSFFSRLFPLFFFGRDRFRRTALGALWLFFLQQKLLSPLSHPFSRTFPFSSAAGPPLPQSGGLPSAGLPAAHHFNFSSRTFPPHPMSFLKSILSLYWDRFFFLIVPLFSAKHRFLALSADSLGRAFLARLFPPHCMEPPF